MRFRLSLAAFLVLSVSAQAQEKYRVYFGTYTGKVSKGIYQCELNLKDGSLSAATLAGETSSPSFLAFHPNKKFLYAVNEGQGDRQRVRHRRQDRQPDLPQLAAVAGRGAVPSRRRSDGQERPRRQLLGRKLHLHPDRGGRQARQGNRRSSSTRARRRTGIRSTSTRPTSSPCAATWAWTRSSSTPSTPARER